MNTALIARNGGEDGGGSSNASSAASTPSTVKPRTIISSSSNQKQSIQDLYDELDESASMISAQTYTVNTPGMSAAVDVPDNVGRDSTPTRSGGRSPAPSTRNQQRPGSASKRDPSGGTPRKTAHSRLMKPRPTTPKARPKSDGSGDKSPRPGSSPVPPAEKSGSMESIDSKTVILSRSESAQSMEGGGGNENEVPASPSRGGGGKAPPRASRLQRPSSSKSRPDTLKIAAANKPQ